MEGLTPRQQQVLEFIRESVRLQPENELYEPIIVNADEVQLVGRVVGVLRQL